MTVSSIAVNHFIERSDLAFAVLWSTQFGC